MQDAISRSQVRRITDSLDERAAQAVEEAASAINRAEQTIRSRVRSIRAALDAIEERLDAGSSLNDCGELGRQPLDLDMAIAVRHSAWQTLGALLRPEELAALRQPQQ